MVVQAKAPLRLARVINLLAGLQLLILVTGPVIKLLLSVRHFRNRAVQACNHRMILLHVARRCGRLQRTKRLIALLLQSLALII